MANVSYDSPSSLRPDIAYKPDGFLGGMWAGQRQNDYRQSLEQSNLMKALSAKEEMNKLAEFSANAPVRDAERLSKIAGFNSNAATIGDIQGGQAAQGRTMQQTQGADVQNKLAQWMASQSKWKQEDIDRHASNMEGVGETLFNMPGHDTLEGQAARDQMLQNLRKQYPDLGLPEKWDAAGEAKVAQQYQHAKMIKQIKQREDLAKTQMTTQAQLQAHEMDNASKERIAEETRKAKAAAEAKVGSIDVEINKLLAKQAKTGSLTPGELQQLQQLQQDRIGAQAAKMVAYGLPPQILNQGPTTPEAIGAAARGMAQGANAVPSTAPTQTIKFDAQGNRVQ